MTLQNQMGREALEDWADWLRLLETPGIGRETARQLLLAFGEPSNIFSAQPLQWERVVGSRLAQLLGRSPKNWEALVQVTHSWLQDQTQPRAVVCLGDSLYPAGLLQTPDPPLVLYMQGRFELLQRQALAIVGSRNPTPQGADNARAFAQHLSRVGVTVISGLAQGIDGAAHEGALTAVVERGPQAGSTIAVVGTGLDRVYPARHRELAHRMAINGLLISEYTLGTPPLAAHFPQRNRLIAALSQGTLVVEAALASGSLITARLALECNREVFAIPGSIHSPQARGCHALIKQGAKLVESAQDILEELPQLSTWLTDMSHAPAPTSAPSSEDDTAAPDPLLTALGYDPVGLEALSQRTGWPAQELNVRLLELELNGQVERLPGQQFQRLVRG
jgi:DNA processing protein